MSNLFSCYTKTIYIVESLSAELAKIGDSIAQYAVQDLRSQDNVTVMIIYICEEAANGTVCCRNFNGSFHKENIPGTYVSVYRGGLCIIVWDDIL